MDKNRALNILGLDSKATREEAKKAFRSLAKICHPDRFAGDRAGTEKAEARMKEINGAFHCLLLVLPLAKAPAPPKRAEAVNRSGFFSKVRDRWKKRTRPKSGQRVSKPGSVPPNPPVYMKKKTKPAGPHFDTLLNAIAPDTKNHSLNPSATAKFTRSYENYCRYMAVKKKINKNRNRPNGMGIGRVEKISRVRPVDSIGRK